MQAHAKRRDDGTYYFENARDAKLYEVMVEASKIPGRFYRNSGPCDILSIALDTKEPPGRARGIGVNVPHKRAFTLSKEERLSMKKARSEMKQNALFEKLKKEIYPAVRKDVEESMMMQKTLTLTDSQQMGGGRAWRMLVIVRQHRTRVALHQLTPATLTLQLQMMMLYLIYLECKTD